MGEFAAAEFEIVRREIDDQQAAARIEHTGGFHDRGLRIFEVVQHLMENREIEAVIRDAGYKRQTMNIAQSYLAMLRVNPLQPVARDRQHLGAVVDARASADMRREQFKHATGARAGVKDGSMGKCFDEGQDGGFDLLVRRVQRTDAFPVCRIGAEEFSGRRLPGLPDGIKPRPIRGKWRWLPADQSRQHIGELPTFPAVGSPIEDPTAFFEPL